MVTSKISSEKSSHCFNALGEKAKAKLFVFCHHGGLAESKHTADFKSETDPGVRICQFTSCL